MVKDKLYPSHIFANHSQNLGYILSLTYLEQDIDTIIHFLH